MKFKVDGWNNFCMVFELPDRFASGFCHNGGHETNFQLIDWFYPVPDIWQAAVSKEVYEKEVGPIEVKEVTLEDLAETLMPFLTAKEYVEPGKQYLVICDFGATILFDKRGLIREGNFINELETNPLVVLD